MTTQLHLVRPFVFVVGLVFTLTGLLLPVQVAGAQDDPLAVSIEYEPLTTDTEEPMSIQVTDDGRVIWTEREGAVRILTPDGEQVMAGRLAVSGNLCSTCEPDDSPKLEEGGLYGVLLAPDFNATGRLYLFRAMPGSRDGETRRGVWRLSTFVLDPATNQLDLGSEVEILEVEVFWDECCHYGGDLDYLPDGTILLSTGDDTPASSSDGYGPRDASETWLDAELRVLNPADRRGKILRLMPDGSVPDGSQPGIEPNPFVGVSEFHPYIEPNLGDAYQPWVRSETGSEIEYDPYVYATGFKQPFKGTVNPYTGHAFYGDVGPDAGEDDPERGPEGYDERNVIPPGGGTSYGWPRCIADNRPYIDVDWTTMEVGDPLDCSEMEPAVFYYPHGESEEFPETGSGGTTGSPVEFYPADTTGALRLPAFFDDTVIDLEWSRNWFATFDLDDEGGIDPSTFQRWDEGVELGTPVGAPAVIPGFALSGPIDADVGPDGAIYIAEYGTGYYAPVASRIGRLKCDGCTSDPADYEVDDPGAPDDDPTDPATEPTTEPPTEPAPTETSEPATPGDTDQGPQPAPLPATGSRSLSIVGVALMGLALIGVRRRSLVV